MVNQKSLQSAWIANQFLKYWEVARVHYRASATYLANVFSRGILVAFRVWIYVQLYQITFKSADRGVIGGLDLVMTLWVLMFAFGFQSTTKPILSKIIEDDVRSGNIAYSLGRPYSYILFHYFAFLGRVVPNMIFNTIIGSITILWLVGPYQFSFLGLLLAIPLLIFGFTLDYCISAIIGVFAFWFEDIEAFIWIYRKAQLILGGILLPLSLFPEKFRSIVELLPFSQLYYSAARILVKPEHPLFWRFAIVQLVWIIVTMVILKWLFGRATKNISINGG